MLVPPKPLPENGHIVVLAASGPSDSTRIEHAARRIENRGYRVTIAPNVGTRHRGYLAGDDDVRTENLNQFLRDSSVDAFFFARGGYGAMRILERLDYAAMAANPRPLVGFSDVTALHQAMALRADVAGFHGPMLNLDFHDALSDQHEQWLWDALSGNSPLHHAPAGATAVVHGEAEGVLFGGCLALTEALLGTPFDYWVDDGIWFWEDVDEPPYRLDRMLTSLRLAGRFERLRGVIVGRLKNCGSDDEIDALLQDFFGSRNIPVVRDFPFGHHGDNLLMPIGANVRLSTAPPSFTIPLPVTGAPLRFRQA